MEGRDVLGTVSLLVGADPTVCDRDGLASLLRHVDRAENWLAAFRNLIGARATELARDGSCESATSLFGQDGRRSGREAQAAARRAAVCAAMPQFQKALESGVVSAEHADAVAGLVRGLDASGQAEVAELADALVQSAAAMPVDAFARECRDLGRILSGDDGNARHAQLRQQRNVRRWMDRQTGMCKTLITLDPEADAKVWTAINAAVGAERVKKKDDDDRTWDHLVTDTVVDLITGARAVNNRVPEVSVIIDFETLKDGLHDESTCETESGVPVPPDVVRRMACDGDIIPVVLGGKSETLDVGRARRLATRAQRTALAAMYRTCGFPGCTVPLDGCRIHHVEWWEHGGRSDLANELPLCESEHHHLVHEGGWQLSLKRDRTVTIRRPDGTLFFEGSTVDREGRAPPGRGVA
jgi:hypothetical protein